MPKKGHTIRHHYAPAVALLLGLLLFALGTQRVFAISPIYVTPSGSGGGGSWGDPASLQGALSTATAGDEIWVKKGIYTPGTTVTDTFTLKGGMAVYGGFAGTESDRSQRNWQTNVTVLSGDIDNNDVGKDANGVISTTANLRGTNSAHVVYADGRFLDSTSSIPTGNLPITSTTVLDGFTITGGKATDNGGGFYCDGRFGGTCDPHLENITFSGNAAANMGGALLNNGNPGSSSPSLMNVTFSGNSANLGGAMANNSGLILFVVGLGISSPSLVNVTFSDNSAYQGGAIYNEAYGGKITPILDNVTFTGNSASGDGGAMYNYAHGGLFGSTSDPRMHNVTFTGNSASGDGGAIYSYSDFSDQEANHTDIQLVNVTFTDNSAFHGGAMYNKAWGTANTSNAKLVNVLFAKNSASADGGAMYNWGNQFGNASPKLTNVTFAGNSAVGYGAAMYNLGGYQENVVVPLLANVIFWGNSSSSDKAFYDQFARIDIATSLIEGGYYGLTSVIDEGGNLTADPQFVNFAADNFQLAFGSPAIDNGTNAANSEVTDIAGNTRVLDGDGDGTATIDMGAYEAPAHLDTLALTVAVTGSGTVNRAPSGAACPSSCAARYLPGTAVTLTPAPDPGWRFTGWSGDCTGMGGCSVTMESAKSVTAAFTENIFKLHIYSVGSGEITTLPYQESYYDGTDVTLYATPADGYSFAGWSGDCTGTDSCAVTMYSDKTMTATFTYNPYVILVNIVGSGAVYNDPDQSRYAAGQAVNLSAIPDNGYSFAGWSGDCSGTDSSCDLTTDSDKDVTATFTQIPQSSYTLSVTKVGNGTVTKTPDQATYASGTEVNLTASPASGFTFTGWSGAGCSGTGGCTVTMNSDQSVSATFIQNGQSSYALTVTTFGSGTVSKSPDQATYSSGTVVTLTPHANDGFTFSGWSGACTGTGACSVTMTGAKSVTATFTQNGQSSFALTLHTVGGGTVSKAPDQATYLSGAVVTVTPHANDGYTFSGWSGACSGAGACSVTMTSATSVTATFTKNDTPGNDPPSFASTAGLTATVGASYSYAVIALDPDSGDTLTLSAPVKPSWLTLTPTGNGTATLSGTPGSANVGVNPVQLRVQDGAGAFDTQSFTITVAATDPTTTGSIQGTVVDGDGKGIEGATVTLTTANSQAAVAAVLTQVTDSNGGYLFEGVPLGDYTLTVTIDGKAPSVPLAVSVQAGQTATVPAIALSDSSQPTKSSLHMPFLGK